MSQDLITVKDLTVAVQSGNEDKTLIDRVNLSISSQSIVGLVGGSGSGKTTTGLSILRLLPTGLKISKGSIYYRKGDLLNLPEGSMRQLRGKEIGMVFQEPLNAFNPVFSISYQINEVLQLHTDLKSKQRKERILELLDIVGIKDPKRVANNFPHQLSGGMRQRAMIAQAIAANPKLIIADEPTSNLDVTLQARIIELFRSLKKTLELSILLITHDLGMVGHLCDEVNVMKDGRIVERGATDKVMKNPSHNYTRDLIQALGT